VNIVIDKEDNRRDLQACYGGRRKNKSHNSGRPILCSKLVQISGDIIV
jgi:hypothetical protein